MEIRLPHGTASLKVVAAGALATVLAIVPGSAALASTTTTWSAVAGTDTPDHAIQANGFFPNDLTISVGDVVTWNAHSGEVHSVSFGTPPPPGGIVDAQTRVTDSTGGGADVTFDGTKWVNSGLLSDVSSGSPNSSYSVKFSAPGDYQFQCLVHSTMHGTLHVLQAGRPVPHTQAFYNQEIIGQQLQLLGKGLRVFFAGLRAALFSRTPAATAGDGQLYTSSSVAVLRFLPSANVIKVGQSVTWTNLDPETPHTVTFGPDPTLIGGPFAALHPIGASGGQATISGPVTSTINSGFLAAPTSPFGINGTQFKVTFTAPGTYTYRCVLHDDLGMTGTIRVLPSS